MAKRGYKLRILITLFSAWELNLNYKEFLAHSANVNCLSIGKKTSRLLLTGGDDCKVNLWSIGKSTSLTSLCGHTSPIDSVTFNTEEALVLAGASSGVIKLWNLQEAMTSHECSVTSTRPDRASPPRVMPTKLNQTDDMASDTSHITSRRRTSPTQMLATPTEIDNLVDMAQDETHVSSQTDSDITENLMQTHEEFLSTLQSRLTKLQIVRHFWERSDVKGAIGALRKLTDQSVQADVISILTDKIEILTLDMFSQLVPVLTSLLGSRTERPVNVSLDMLLKLVAVFGTVIRSTVSAPRIVGVDLHADEREVKGITMQDTNLPSLFCGTAQDSKDSSNSRKKRRSNNKKGSRTKPCSSTNIATCKANNDHGAALQVLVNYRTSPPRVMPTKLNQTDDMASDTSHITSRRRTSPTQMLATPTEIDNLVDMAQDETHVSSQTDSDITENLMQTHEEFLSTLQSRLTKLQIVRHFWERSDVKGAIGALRKLTDQSVQADVISILTDKIEILTLDMFSQLVPVLTSLLGSRTERPVNVSLDMLLKLVAVFGTVIRSTVSAPRIVGVDLHADERIQICQVCSAGLHKIQRILPILAR
ncbi:hypothetical protein F2Q70_00041868 [Brassica cretica]|uniref:Katanin p80 subunit C-terminal domain-containing protein n=1 Tax=Brassica cretica TaxID=69181 RepID=A0A8S9K6I9_BRACR|nr:hypothetical protein F2Q70_00041868 [Brassica cretica]